MFVFLFWFFVVILSITVHETEGRRLVLRGRRTITRHYYSKYDFFFPPSQSALESNMMNIWLHGSHGEIIIIKKKYFLNFKTAGLLVPAWVVIVFVALGEIVLGAVLFFVLRYFVLTKSEEPMSSTYQPALLEESSN